MAIVRSFGTLQAVDPRQAITAVTSSYSASYNRAEAYASIYATQPNVRKCVDFLSRNIAQLGWHVFRRLSDTDRVRLIDHELVQWIDKPNPYTTRYRLFESLVADLALYFNAYWLKLRIAEPERRIGLVRIPPAMMRVEGGLLPSRFVWTVNGTAIPLATDEVVYFNGYNPLNALEGLAPVETLRQILNADIAASEHRESYWRNASRVEGVIERPKDVPKWTLAQKQSFRQQWQERHTGTSGAGSVAVLEDGMTFRPTAFSPKDSEYSTARKLAGEECASAWHIPLPMVGYLDHATFSNVKEQHKQLYADCLGPWNEMITEAVEMQLLPECRDTVGVYGEFNIADKMKGSFEEQAIALNLLIGRPVMTANEGRGRLNLPRIDDPSADRLAEQAGAPAPAPQPTADQAAARRVVSAHLARQASRLARFTTGEAKAEALNVERCIGELAADLTPILGHSDALTAAARITDHTYSLLREGREAFTTEREVSHAA